jgi:serine/threonine-protein kinase
MSPEQVRGLEGDARSDVYSLGILLYEMLTGRVPFQSNSEYDLMKAQIEEAPKPPRSFTPQIPLQVEQAIMRSLAKKPEARYQTAGEFRAILLGTLGASTNPLASKAAGYSAPVTKIIEPMQSAPISGDTAAAKIAEPADRGTVAYVSGIPVVGASSRSKDTLEDEASNSGPIAAPRTDERPAAPAAVATPTTSVARRGLGWKHYTAAAGVIVAAVAAAIAYVQFGASQPAQMNDAAQPAAVVEPAPQPESANANVSDAAALPLEPENSNESSQNVNRLDPYRHARTRDAANNNGSATAQPVDSTPEPVDTKPAQTIAQPEVQPQPQQPQVATSQNQNAAAAKDEKKKKGGGVGGFFKKVFGGGEKKNNKNAKKP